MTDRAGHPQRARRRWTGSAVDRIGSRASRQEVVNAWEGDDLSVSSVPIELQAPFNSRALVAFLAARAVPGIELAQEQSYQRTLRLAHGPGTVRLDFEPGLHQPGLHENATVRATFRLRSDSDQSEALRQCRQLLNAQADPTRIDAVLAADPALAASVAAHPGLRLPGAVNGPEILLRALMGQQISVAAARTALSRLAERVAARLPDDLRDSTSPLTMLFPDPSELAGLSLPDIPGPARRARSIIGTAQAIAAGDLVIDSDSDPDRLAAELLARPGIGPWTVGYVAMRVLADPDVLLTGDLVLRQGAAALGLPSDPRSLLIRADRWRPYRSYAGLHLWLAAGHAGDRQAGPVDRRQADPVGRRQAGPVDRRQAGPRTASQARTAEP